VRTGIENVQRERKERIEERFEEFPRNQQSDPAEGRIVDETSEPDGGFVVHQQRHGSAAVERGER
jgi:hypothetical protein